MVLDFVLARVEDNILTTRNLSNSKIVNVYNYGVRFDEFIFDKKFKFLTPTIYEDTLFYQLQDEKFKNIQRVGYKTFDKNNIKKYTPKKWYQSSNLELITAFDNNNYISGFDIFWNLSSARRNLGRIYKVMYKDVTTLGLDVFYNEIVIARSFKIIKEIS